MTSNSFLNNKLKYIFSNNIVHNFFQLCKYFQLLPKSHVEYMIFSIAKFLACRDSKKGFVSFKCPKCSHTHSFALSCKSKLCPSCGFAYAQKWTQNVQKNILNINHRHVLFTVPHECREFFFYDRTLLNKLASAVNDIFKYQFHNLYHKNQRVNKIPKSSPHYFTNSDIVHYGLITVIHTFGRDLKWNPHIHAIVSLGGFNKHFQFKKFNFFNVNSIAGQWKFHVLNIIADGNYPDTVISKKAKNIVNRMYAQNVRLFFNVGDGNVNNPYGIIKYLGRYLARSPIAEYKITDISDKEVTFFFNDLKNDKKKTFVTMEINKFIQQVLIHLPPKNFKSVSRFGFYARRISPELKTAIRPFKKNIVSSNYSFFERQMFKTFGISPFYCPECKIKMKIYQFYSYFDPGGLRQYS